MGKPAHTYSGPDRVGFFQTIDVGIPGLVCKRCGISLEGKTYWIRDKRAEKTTIREICDECYIERVVRVKTQRANSLGAYDGDGVDRDDDAWIKTLRKRHGLSDGCGTESTKLG